MGISCKPEGKMRSLFAKMEYNEAKQREKMVRDKQKKANNKEKKDG